MIERLNARIESLLELSDDDLRHQIFSDAEHIVSRTPVGEPWDFPEDWQFEAVRLAHAIAEFMKRQGVNI
jgi:hypothetical protein